MQNVNSLFNKPHKTFELIEIINNQWTKTPVDFLILVESNIKNSNEFKNTIKNSKIGNNYTTLFCADTQVQTSGRGTTIIYRKSWSHRLRNIQKV